MLLRDHPSQEAMASIDHPLNAIRPAKEDAMTTDDLLQAAQHGHARRAPSFRIQDPAGSDIRIPATIREDRTYFPPDRIDDIHAYYRTHGYVVVRGLVPAERCRAALRLFRAEVKPHRDPLYRQTTANPERHVFTDTGFMLNPILNVQSLDRRRFPRFRRIGLDVMTDSEVQAILATIMGERAKIVQTMYFEGNPVTWAHQDSYYLDAEEMGRMVGAWFAMEDIAPGAGRFYVYPKTHIVELNRNGGGIDYAFNHARYKDLVIDFLRDGSYELRAPALKQGDVLFWSSRVLHGSLDTTQPDRSRSSFTAHYIPASMRLLQFQSRIRGLNLHEVNGMRVHFPKDLSHRPQRMVFWIETRFPLAFRTAKKIAIKAHTR